MKISFIVFLCIAILTSTAVLALPHLSRRKSNEYDVSSDTSSKDNKPISSHEDSKPASDTKSSKESKPSSSHEDSKPASTQKKSDPTPKLTPSSSQGKESHHDSPFKITSPESGKCYHQTSDVTISWTTSITNEKVKVRILSYDNPSFSLGTDSKNVVDASVGKLTIKIKDWPVGSYLAMVALVKDLEKYGTSGRFYVCNSTMLPPIEPDDSE
ncbi:34860_t:CDS:2 [Racocetra persica]|uniref:34860_t:CDS:1 n=1 Tax=Racocetra persica TaxID=160502 RepID=A0ACA9KQW2_9GLOM|nr:34860_t:CDS:2 [Racocetra persica]